MKKIRVGILGSTGSVGRQALEVIAENPGRFQTVLLAGGSNTPLLSSQVARFRPETAVSLDPSFSVTGKTTVYRGAEALADPAIYKNCDVVVNAVGGIAGLLPTLAVLESPAQLATANKESLAAAGKQIREAAVKNKKTILPVDSEHSAVFQCLEKNTPEKIILTASGGAFRYYTKEQLSEAKAADALKHPVWSMGKKVTVDSATMMNKGLEILEAYWLFGTANIDVVIHRESIVHALVQFADGSLKAVLSRPDMKLPIQYALTYPGRQACLPALDLSAIGALHFEKPDEARFPCLGIARQLLASPQKGVILSAADEAAVDAYLQGKIGFYGIPALIEDALAAFSAAESLHPSEILRIDRAVKEYTLSRIQSEGNRLC